MRRGGGEEMVHKVYGLYFARIRFEEIVIPGQGQTVYPIRLYSILKRDQEGPGVERPFYTTYNFMKLED